MILVSELKECKKKDNIINGKMKSNGLYCLVAKPKVGKSFLALQLADSVANNKQFLGQDVNASPVLYVSTELSKNQLKERLELTDYDFNDSNFFFLQKDLKNSLSIKEDLLLSIKEFSEEKNGKLVIIDMMLGIDYGFQCDINNYTEVYSTLFNTYRNLIEKYNVTFLLIHHLNKQGTTLGSTGIDGSVDGIFTLTSTSNSKYLLEISSRDYSNKIYNLEKSNNMVFNESKEYNNEIDYNISLFLRYVIKKQQILFTPSQIVADLNLAITPTKFGMLLSEYKQILEQEGIYVEYNRTTNSRNYKATFIDPMILDNSPNGLCPSEISHN